MKLHRILNIVVASLTISLAPLKLPAQTTLPPIVVTAPRIGGGTIICRGMACAGVLKALAGPDYYVELPLQPDTVSKPLDPDRVCANLEQAQPPTCNAGNPPSVPGYDPNWIANGCGSGTFTSTFGSLLLSIDPTIPDYTGDLDNPLPNISFYGACTSHDRCYGTQGGPLHSKASCDALFSFDMSDVCSSSSSTYSTQCDNVRTQYVAGVQSFVGDNAYDAAQSELACAAWVSDMEENECDQ